MGRKIGFTNTTIWPRYGVYQPMWAHVWTHSVQFAKDAHASLELRPFVQPRIEPEVVFRLKTALAPTSDPLAVTARGRMDRPGLRDRPVPFPGLEIRGGGLHRRLRPARRTRCRYATIAVTDRNRDALAAALPTFTLTLRRGRSVIERGVGANVLGGPTHALAHLSRVLAAQPQFPPLAPGEIVTTGTITDAWPVAPRETWTSDYGTLGLRGVTL